MTSIIMSKMPEQNNMLKARIQSLRYDLIILIKHLNTLINIKLNSLTAMDSHEPPLFNKLHRSLITCQWLPNKVVDAMGMHNASQLCWG
jgi:hypothetical protein